jgi:hypothetical protein
LAHDVLVTGTHVSALPVSRDSLQRAPASYADHFDWSFGAKILGLILLILASKFFVLRLCSSPLPVFDQWQAEGQHLLLPWLRGELRLSDLFAPWAQHRIVWTRLLTLGLFELNGGQWDTQVEAIAAECIHACTAGVLGVILVRRLGRASEDAILLGLLLLFGLPFGQENTLGGGFASQYYTLLLFAVVAIRGLASHRAGTAGWWIGVGAAFLGWFSLATGGLAALSVAVWMGWRLARREGPGRENGITLGVALALGLGGLGLSLGVPQQHSLQARSPVEFLGRFAGLMGWPHLTAWAAPLEYAPFAWLLWRTARRRPRTGPAEAFLIPLGIFAVLHAAALAFARAQYGGLGVSRYMDFLCFGTVVNFGCLLLFLRENGALPVRRRTPAGLLALGWVVATGVGLSQLTARNIADDLPFVKNCSEQEVTNVAAFVARPDWKNFLAKDPFEVMCNPPAAAAALLQDPAIRGALPWPVRLPVIIEGAAVSPHAFMVQGTGSGSNSGWVLEPRQDGQPVYFRSRTINGLRLPYLCFPQISSLNGNAFVVLVADDSGKMTWLPQRTALGEWQSLLVKTPAGPFHLEAVLAAGSNQRLAFSFPHEMGWLSAWVGTVLDSAVGLLFAGCGLWLGAIFWPRLRCSGGL